MADMMFIVLGNISSEIRQTYLQNIKCTNRVPSRITSFFHCQMVYN